MERTRCFFKNDFYYFLSQDRKPRILVPSYKTFLFVCFRDRLLLNSRVFSVFLEKPELENDTRNLRR